MMIKTMIGTMENDQGDKEDDDQDDEDQDEDRNEEASLFVPLPPLTIERKEKEEQTEHLMTYDKTILASSEALTAKNRVKEDKLAIAKLGRWVPMIYKKDGIQHAVLTSALTTGELLKQTGVWFSPAPNNENNSSSNNGRDAYVSSMINSRYYYIVAKTKHHKH